jgi:hypothetical protein
VNGTNMRRAQRNMASQLDFRVLKQLRGKLLDSVHQMNERIECDYCPVPIELGLIADRLGEYCRERGDAALEVCKKAKSFGSGFFLWAQRNGCSEETLVENARQLRDCQEWVNVVLYSLITL